LLDRRISERLSTSDGAWPIASAGIQEAARPGRAASGPKILLYSHDTFGLGNIRRTLLLSQALTAEFANASILIVTGSPVIHAFRIPDGMDYIKLPSLDRVDADCYEPRFLQEWSHEVKATRRAMLRTSVLGFNPDLMIVDKRPSGVDGELLDTLRALRCQTRSTKLVVGIRDILDDPAHTRRSLRHTRSFAIIKTFYDEVWIYGHRDIFDPVEEYAFPRAIRAKTYFCGYLQRPSVAPSPRASGPQVLVTTGGGGDGGDVIENYLEGLLDLPRRVVLRSVIMFGPQMPDARRAEILGRFGHLADVIFRDFEPDLTPYYAEADVVVSMAGYNTVCELLSFGKRAILVPRENPVCEQLIRARLFAGRGLFDMLEPSELAPGALMSRVLAAIAQGPPSPPALDLSGLEHIRERSRQLLNGNGQEA
jgi:predicted glycosyltransferase